MGIHRLHEVCPASRLGDGKVKDTADVGKDPSPMSDLVAPPLIPGQKAPGMSSATCNSQGDKLVKAGANKHAVLHRDALLTEVIIISQGQ